MPRFTLNISCGPFSLCPTSVPSRDSRRRHRPRSRIHVMHPRASDRVVAVCHVVLFVCSIRGIDRREGEREKEEVRSEIGERISASDLPFHSVSGRCAGGSDTQAHTHEHTSIQNTGGKTGKGGRGDGLCCYEDRAAAMAELRGKNGKESKGGRKCIVMKEGCAAAKEDLALQWHQHEDTS